MIFKNIDHICLCKNGRMTEYGTVAKDCGNGERRYLSKEVSRMLYTFKKKRDKAYWNPWPVEE